MAKEFRKRLTNEEFNAISHWTAETKMDMSIDIDEVSETEDGFFDFDEQKFISLQEGLKIVEDAIVYTFKHEGLTKREGELIANLLVEFEVCTPEEIEWALSEEED